MQAGQISKKIFIKGKIKLITGMAIGGTDAGLEIGGIDKVMIRDPITNQPYIPGSSLKGKMRSLLEKLEGKFGDKPISETVRVGPYLKQGQNNSLIGELFGVPAEYAESTTRLIVRDSRLSNPEKFEESMKLDIPYAEIKTEVVIDRITSAAMPRTFERVPPGAEFSLDIVLNVLEGDKDKESKLLNTTFRCLQLVQDDYIGGSGSRGYGQVKFHIESLTYKDKSIYESEQDNSSKPYTDVEIPDSLKFKPASA